MTTAASRKATLVRGWQPGLLGRITQMHGEYYARALNLGAGFEVRVARELCEFREQYRPERDLLLTAHADGRVVGSVAVDGSESGHPGARLRWLVVEPAHQGHGLGSALLGQSLQFCREHGVARVHLWTLEELPQAMRLYERVGFRPVERVSDARYTVPLTSCRMEMLL